MRAAQGQDGEEFRAVKLQVGQLSAAEAIAQVGRVRDLVGSEVRKRVDIDDYLSRWSASRS